MSSASSRQRRAAVAQERGQRLSPASYLRSHGACLVILALLEALLVFIMRVAGVGSDLALLICVLIAGAACLALAAGYLRVQGFYRQLGELAETLDDPLLLLELVEEPSFAEGRISYEALRSVTRSANERVAAYRRHVEEYREYIELWVHEAKSPLAAAHLALENLKADPSTLMDDPASLRSIDDELHRVEGYIEQALFYARSESVERDYLVRRHALRGIVVAAVRANAGLLIGAHVTPLLDESLDLAVFTDEKWLVFMLGQLLQNSVRYAKPGVAGGSHIWFSAQLVGEGSAGECVELEVRDNGCGVNEADLARVFDRGFTGENGRAHKRSTGLGLWLVAQLATKMGLLVRADSREGKGFSVTFAFPTNKMHYFEDEPPSR